MESKRLNVWPVAMTCAAIGAIAFLLGLALGKQIQYDKDFPPAPQAFVQKCDPPQWWLDENQETPGYSTYSENPNSETGPDGEPFDYCDIPKQRPKVDCSAYADNSGQGQEPKNPEMPPRHLYEDCPELAPKEVPRPALKVTCKEYRELNPPGNHPNPGKLIKPKGCRLKK